MRWWARPASRLLKKLGDRIKQIAKPISTCINTIGEAGCCLYAGYTKRSHRNALIFTCASGPGSARPGVGYTRATRSDRIETRRYSPANQDPDRRGRMSAKRGHAKRSDQTSFRRILCPHLGLSWIIAPSELLPLHSGSEKEGTRWVSSPTWARSS